MQTRTSVVVDDDTWNMELWLALIDGIISILIPRVNLSRDGRLDVPNGDGFE